MRVTIEIDDQTKRRTAVINFLDQAYLATGHWENLFVVVGVDYEDFRQFYAVSHGECSFEHTLMTLLDAQFGSPSHYTLKRVQESPFVGPLRAANAVSIVETYVAYKSEAALSECMISIALKPVTTSDTKVRLGFDAYNDLERLKQKYRLPIFDIALINKRIYILLTRNCGERDRVYALMLDLLRREGAKSIPRLSAPVFEPDLGEYKFSRAYPPTER